MNFTMSLLIYNPLEALLLLTACYLFRDKSSINTKFNFKKYIIHSYILGFIFLLIQYPMVWIENPVMFFIYNNFIGIIVMSYLLFFYNKKIRNKINLMKCFAIFIIYFISIDFILNLFNFSYNLDRALLDEFIINIVFKICQFILLFGGYILKKFLINLAKKNIGKSIASTIKGVYEPKLSKELEQEIK